ncbi:DUF2256 domain-containing protein [Nevskia sp.]|uniref:DUF2256 domain-containing protein n=1 Tax=Nevskia sp. TaxID=1929292 RepID=UPI003F6E65B0
MHNPAITPPKAAPVPHRKPHLPEKTCAVCQRPFAWRKKWEKVWDEVRYCSDACRSRRSSAGAAAGSSAASASPTPGLRVPAGTPRRP